MADTDDDARWQRFADDVSGDADQLRDQRGPVSGLIFGSALLMVLIRGVVWVVTFGVAGPLGGWTYAFLAHLLHRDDAYWRWQDTDVWIFVWTLTAALALAVVNLIGARWPAWIAHYFAIAMIAETALYLGSIAVAAVIITVESEISVVGVVVMASVIALANTLLLTQWRAVERRTRWAVSRCRIRWRPSLRPPACPTSRSRPRRTASRYTPPTAIPLRDYRDTAATAGSVAALSP